jgi:signal peptidase I
LPVNRKHEFSNHIGSSIYDLPDIRQMNSKKAAVLVSWQPMVKRALSWFKTHLWLVLFASIVLGLAPAYLQAYSITAGGISEVPTILAGDTVIVNRAAYDLRLPYSNLKLLHTGSPSRGDMVLIRNPTSGWPAPKRVIGVPGDEVEVRDNRVLVDGQPLVVKTLDRSDFAWVPESNKLGSVVQNEDGHWIAFTPDKSENRNHPLIRLEGGQYFVLGDNRDESADSRAWGPLHGDLILGKVILILPLRRRR